MKALCWHGKNDVRIDNVPDPELHQAGDVILKVTSTAICGSDLHLSSSYEYAGYSDIRGSCDK